MAIINESVSTGRTKRVGENCTNPFKTYDRVHNHLFRHEQYLISDVLSLV